MKWTKTFIIGPRVSSPTNVLVVCKYNVSKLGYQTNTLGTWTHCVRGSCAGPQNVTTSVNLSR